LTIGAMENWHQEDAGSGGFLHGDAPTLLEFIFMGPRSLTFLQKLMWVAA
jgi:hypothetical protein